MAMTAIHMVALGPRHLPDPGQERAPPPGLTSVAEGQTPLLACLDVGHPQVIAVDEGEEGGVGRADLGVHPGPGALGLDFQGLHGGHLGTQMPGSGEQEVAQPPDPARGQWPGLTMKPFLPPSRQWKRLLLAWKRKRPLSPWKS